MTVFVYVNTSKQVGDVEHIKVFANQDAAETWLEENDLKALPSSTKCWLKQSVRAMSKGSARIGARVRCRSMEPGGPEYALC
jgi:hypothetical protein